MRLRHWGVLGFLGMLGCSKTEPETTAPPPAAENTKTLTSAAPAPTSVAPEAQQPAPTASAASRSIVGLGEVADWAPNKSAPGECPITNATRLAAINRGDDAEVATGEADAKSLLAAVSGDCPAGRAKLATALNTGAFALYKNRNLEAASHFWAATLNVDPAHIKARYNLACALALSGHGEDALWALGGVARAAKSGDSDATTQLAKARDDSDLAKLREMPQFIQLVGAGPNTAAVFEGPRQDAGLSAQAVKLLPREYHEDRSPSGELVHYKPALAQVWTWRPSEQVDLVVATVIDDLARIGKPVEDLNDNYWGIAVFRKEGEKLTFLDARKVGDEAPDVSAGPGGSVLYSNDDLNCGMLRGQLSWRGGKLVVGHDICIDRGGVEQNPPAIPRATGHSSATVTANAPPAMGQAAPPAAANGPFKACDLARVDWANRAYDDVQLTSGAYHEGQQDTTLDQVLTHDFDGDGKVEAIARISWREVGGGGGSWSVAHVYKTGTDCLVTELPKIALGVYSDKLQMKGEDLVCIYHDLEGNTVAEKFRWRKGKLESVDVKRKPGE